MNKLLVARRRLVAGLAGTATLGGFGVPIRAQQGGDSRPLVLVVPFPPGGAVDAIARQVAIPLGTRTGNPVVVENRPGANGQIGTQFVARAKPDGHTLLLGNDGNITIAPVVQNNLPYDPERALLPIAMLARVPAVLTASADVPFADTQGLIAYAKANPGRLAYGSFGPASGPQILAEIFAQRAGIELLHVPFQGMAPINVALKTGTVQLVFAAISSQLPYIRSGQVKAIAVVSSARNELLPQVPTFAESGLPNFELSAWFGIFAPRETPDSIAQRLSSEIHSIVTSREFVDTRITPQGLEVASVQPSQFASFLQENRATWADAISKLGSKVKS